MKFHDAIVAGITHILQNRLRAALSMPWILISVFFSVGIGVGFGLYPAMRAARLSPIDALRTGR